MSIISLSYSDANGPHSVDLDRDSMSIGRSPGQDIVLSDPCVSRQHAVIVRDGDTYTVIDQKSTYGTFLNAIRVERAVLKFDDVLQIGSTRGTAASISPPSGRSDNKRLFAVPGR